VLLGVSLVALFAGYALSVSGLFVAASRGTAEERVGRALENSASPISDGQRQQLRSDVESVEDNLDHYAAPVFQLVVELHGLNNGGKTDWERAQALCEGLSWTRCDREELEEIQRRGRP
jgi:hypothetical protein